MSDLWEDEETPDEALSALDQGDFRTYLEMTAPIDDKAPREPAPKPRKTPAPEAPEFTSAIGQIEATKKRLVEVEAAVANAPTPPERGLYENYEERVEREAVIAAVSDLAAERSLLAEELEILERRLPFVGITDEVLVNRSKDLAIEIEEKKEQIQDLEGPNKNARRRRAQEELTALEAELEVLSPELWTRGSEQGYRNDLREIATVEALKARKARITQKEVDRVRLKQELADGDYDAIPVLKALEAELDAARQGLHAPVTAEEIIQHSQAQAEHSTTLPGWWRYQQ